MDTPSHSNPKAIDTHGNYVYTHHLLVLDSCRPVNHVDPPAYLQQVTTPLIVSRWEELLKDHTDQNFANYITSGIHTSMQNTTVSRQKQTCPLP